jgi:hypothetical protein
MNDDYRVICERCNNLEHHSRVINYEPRGIIALIYDVYGTDMTYDGLQLTIVKCNMFIVQATNIV